MDVPPHRRRVASPRAWLAARPYTALTAVVLTGLSAWLVLRPRPGWEDVFGRAAPFLALGSLPFAALPAPAGGWAWLAVSLVALVALVRWAWRLAGGGALEGGGPAGWREHVAAWLGLACGLPYLRDCLAHQRPDVVLGALVVGGCVLLTRSRWWAGATCLGLAGACQWTPLLFAPYLVWRGRRKAAVWLVGVAVGLSFLPDLLSRPAPGGSGLAEFGARFLRPTAHAEGDVLSNQSLAGAGERWLATTWAWAGGECVVGPRPGAVHPLALRGAVCGSALLLLAGALWACGWPFGWAEELTGERVPRSALECGVVVALMLLLSPASGKGQFGVLVLPGFCLARAALGRGGGWLRWCLLVPAVLLAFLATEGPLGAAPYTLALWYGGVTWQGVLLLLGCCLVLRQGRVATAEAPCPAVLLGYRAPGGRAA